MNELLEYKDKPILLSHQLAYLLGIDSNSINYNYNSHIDEFEENEDFFKLESEDLQSFKKYLKDVTFDDVVMTRFVESMIRINKLYLWTEEGVANHAKISNSKNAWKIFKVIKKYYFKNKNSNQLVTLQNQLSSLVQTVTDLTIGVMPHFSFRV